MKHTRVGLLIAALAIAACGRNENAVDPALSADLQAATGNAPAGDLELAPAANKSQVVVSAVEGGPTSAPKAASVKRTPRPTPKPAPRLAAARTPQRAPAPVEHAPVIEAPVEAPAPQPVQQAPAPAGRQPGVYKSEGEIFRQMPWIKP